MSQVTRALLFSSDKTKAMALSSSNELQSISIPNSVIELSPSLFANCTKLQTVKLPKFLRVIPESCFENCASLEKIVMPVAPIESLGKRAFASCKKLRAFPFRSGIVELAESVFENCSSLTSLVIPEGVKIIRKNAMRNCSALEAIVLPKSLEKIEAGAFDGCTSLCHIRLADENPFFRLDENDFSLYEKKSDGSETLILRPVQIEKNTITVSAVADDEFDENDDDEFFVVANDEEFDSFNENNFDENVNDDFHKLQNVNSNFNSNETLQNDVREKTYIDNDGAHFNDSQQSLVDKLLAETHAEKHLIENVNENNLENFQSSETEVEKENETQVENENESSTEISLAQSELDSLFQNHEKTYIDTDGAKFNDSQQSLVDKLLLQMQNVQSIMSERAKTFVSLDGEKITVNQNELDNLFASHDVVGSSETENVNESEVAELASENNSENAENASTGFFSKVDEDETISLSENELENIANTSEVLQENENANESEVAEIASEENSENAENVSTGFFSEVDEDEMISLSENELENIANTSEVLQENENANESEVAEVASENENAEVASENNSENVESANTGFFSKVDEDETISLSENELENITNTSEVSAENENAGVASEVAEIASEENSENAESANTGFFSEVDEDETISLSENELENIATTSEVFAENENTNESEVAEIASEGNSENAETENTGFFSEVDEDETISLSENELENIANTSEVSAENENANKSEVAEIASENNSENAESANTGFFSEVDEDETISLSENELENIANTSEVSAENENEKTDALDLRMLNDSDEVDEDIELQIFQDINAAAEELKDFSTQNKEFDENAFDALDENKNEGNKMDDVLDLRMIADDQKSNEIDIDEKVRSITNENLQTDESFEPVAHDELHLIAKEADILSQKNNRVDESFEPLAHDELHLIAKEADILSQNTPTNVHANNYAEVASVELKAENEFAKLQNVAPVSKVMTLDSPHATYGTFYVFAEKLVDGDFSPAVVSCALRIAHNKGFKQVFFAHQIPFDNEEFAQFLREFLEEKSALYATENQGVSSLSNDAKQFAKIANLELTKDGIEKNQSSALYKSVFHMMVYDDWVDEDF